jgi:hypothetical protein
MRDYGIHAEVQSQFAGSEPSPCAALIREWPTFGIKGTEFKLVVSDLIVIHRQACTFDS